MSLFKRPAWAKQQLSEDEGEGQPQANIFSHSHSYGDIVAEQEQRKREKAEKKKAKAERRESAKREVKDEPNGESTSKRRRITLEESEKLLKGVDFGRGGVGDDEHDGVPEEHTPVRRSPRKQKADGSVKPPSRADVIDLGGCSDEADNQEVQMAPEAPQPAPAAAEDEEIRDDSDDEFAELARKARQQRQQSQNRASNTPRPEGVSLSPGVGPSNYTNHERPPDPVIQLFITSPIEGTNPLIVHRKLSQAIGVIRHAWCQKQGFSEPFTEAVFFIHRMRRVYDVTTCRSLGLEVDEFGNVVMKGAEGKEGVDKVHLEAVTEDIFKQMKENRERDRNGELQPGEEETQEEAPAPEKEESLIRLVLKAKGQKDFRLKVKESTPISKIASAYSTRALGDASKQVRLEFDGEPLDPEDVVRDTEIEDMMVLEVYMIE